MTEVASAPTAEDSYAAPFAKVTAFVTRDGKVGREMLVFRHPTAGVQLPAGSVEADEEAKAAALREVTEETGLTDIITVAKLGTRTYPLPDEGRIIAKAAILLDAPDGKPLKNAFLRRGLTVQEIGCSGMYSQVEFREYTLHNDVLQVARAIASGWLCSVDLAVSVERHFFHIRTTSPTRDNWVWLAEEEHAFECYWEPLADHPRLVSGQDQWLEWYIDRLREGEQPLCPT